MTAAADRQASTPLGDEWLTIGTAAEITGQSVRTWRRRATAEAAEATRRLRQSRAVMMASSRTGEGSRGRPCWHVHRSLDERLTRQPSRQARVDRVREALSAKYPESMVETAYRKVRWLLAWRKACESRRQGRETEADLARTIIAQAKQVEGLGFRMSVRTLQLWRRRYYRRGPSGSIRGVEGLIDGRGVVDETAPASAGRSQDAIDYYYSLFHILNGPSVAMCHDMTCRKARDEGWAWPVSYQATTRFLRSKDDLSLTCLHREGRDVWARRFMPYLEVDWTLVQPGEFYQCDHTQANFWISHRGKQIRPWLTFIVDGRSRCVVGWHLGETPNQAGILRAMRMAFVGWAIPQTIRIDNGADFTCKRITGVSKAERTRLRKALGRDWRQALKRETERVECVDPRFTGIVNELGIELVYAVPFSPWSKGIVERVYRTADTKLFRTVATYCGNAACRKPEVLETIRNGYTRDQKRTYRKRYGRDWKRQAVLRLVDQSDVPTMDQARDALADWLTIYHASEHSGLAGQTPMAVWNTATTLRRAEADALIALTETRGIYKVGPNGVAFAVGGTRLTYGQGCTGLYKHRGRKVLIAQSPDDLSCCYAWTPEAPRRLIGRLDSNDRIAPNASEEDLRDALAKVNHARRDMHEARRTAATSTRSATQEMRRQQHEQAAELRATGTDSPARMPTIRPVQTGFEGQTDRVRKASEAPRRDRSREELAIAEAALAGHRQPIGAKRPRRPVSDAWLAPIAFREAESPKDEGDGDDGKDAGDRPTDVLSLIAGDRHERSIE